MATKTRLLPARPAAFIAALDGYRRDHPGAEIDARPIYEILTVVRVVDPGFAGMSFHSRLDRVWEYLKGADPELVGMLGSMVLVTPDEAPRSEKNAEFESLPH